MLKTFEVKYESERTQGGGIPDFLLEFVRRVEIRRGIAERDTVPLIRIEPACRCRPKIEKKFWRIICPDPLDPDRVRYVTMGNGNELWVKKGNPNDYYAPNLFGTVQESKDHFIVYTFGMIPHEADDCQYALVAEREHGEWKLKYKNENTCSYQWRFISLSSMTSSDDCHSDDSDRYALQWCGPVRSEDAGSNIVMCLDESDPMHPRISLTDLSESDTPDKIPCEHYLHNFNSIKS